MMKRKVSVKIYFLVSFLTIILISLVLYSVASYIAISKVFERELEVSLINFSKEIESSINFETLEKVYIDQDFLQEQDEVFRFSLNEVLIQVREKNGRSIAKSKKLLGNEIHFSKQWLDDLLKNNKKVIDYNFVLDGISKPYMILSYMVPVNKPQYILQVGVPKRYIYGNSISLMKGLLYVIPLLMFFAFIVSYFLIKISGKPILDLGEKVKSLKLEGFNQRIESEFVFTEIDDLRRVINELLERIRKHILTNERFISNASHQLKTPLSILKSEIEMVLLEKEQVSGEQLESISEEINILNEIVDKMLTLAKIDTSQKRESFYEVNLDEILLRSIKLVTRHAASKEIELKLNVAADSSGPDDFSIKGDEFLLISMFQSIFENSIKFSPKRSIIVVSLELHENNYLITIEDMGPGIDESEADKLFERFYSRNSSSIKGTGLGLSIAKQVADLHDASLKIKNRKGDGASFSIEMKKN